MKGMCKCEHLKECHNPHELDVYGGDCTHCDCKIYTWVNFLWTDLEVATKLKREKEK